MATLRNRKFATLNRKISEETCRVNLAQNSNVPRTQKDKKTRVSEEMEGRVTKKLSQEFSKTENRILGGLSPLDDFLMNLLTQGHSGNTPERFRNAYVTNQGKN